MSRALFGCYHFIDIGTPAPFAQTAEVVGGLAASAGAIATGIIEP